MIHIRFKVCSFHFQDLKMHKPKRKNLNELPNQLRHEKFRRKNKTGAPKNDLFFLKKKRKLSIEKELITWNDKDRS